MLTGALFASAVVLGMPADAQAATAAPSISMSSTSYSSQPRPYVARIQNKVAGTKVRAFISNNPGYGEVGMSCSRDGANSDGVGQWRCTGPSTRLRIGSVTVRAQAVSDSDPGLNSGLAVRSASVTSSFSVSGGKAVNEGQPFAVTGRYDHVSGISDYKVSARVTRGGNVVAGQSAVACSLSGTSFRCSLKSVQGQAGTYAVTVTERGPDSRSRTVSQTVTGAAAPAAPSVTVPSEVALDQSFTVSGTAAAGARVQVVVDAPGGVPNWSSPTSSCTASGSGFWACPISGGYQPGTHSISVRAVSATNSSKASPTVTRSTVVLEAEATPTPTPTPKPTPTATPSQPSIPVTPTTTPTPTEAPVAEPPLVAETPAIIGFNGLSGGYDSLLLLLVLALALAALARPGPVSVLLYGSSATFAGPDSERAHREGVPLEDVGLGDQTGSWSFVGHEITDEWSRNLPPFLGRYSPFLTRLSLDGLEIRAMFGALWWLLPGLGLFLGVVSASQSGFEAVPPPLALVLAITLLAAFDATAGFVASVAFGVLVLGDLGPDAGHGFLVILTLGFLWTGLPPLATAVRPFRRVGSLSWRFAWDRVGDLVIVSLLCAWVAHEIFAAFDVIAARETDLPGEAGTAAVVVGLGIATRVAISHMADLWWPERLRATEPLELRDPSNLAIATGFVLRTAVFAFLGHVFIGGCWQWWLGVLLFMLPDVLAFLDARLGWTWSHKVVLPTGVTEVLVLILAGALLVSIAISGADTQEAALRTGFLAAGLAPALLGAAQTFDGSDRPSAASWKAQLGGAAVVLTLLVIALHGWNF